MDNDARKKYGVRKMRFGEAGETIISYEKALEELADDYKDPVAALATASMDKPLIAGVYMYY